MWARSHRKGSAASFWVGDAQSTASTVEDVRTRTVVALVASAVVLTVSAGGVVAITRSVDAANTAQQALDPFYAASSPLPSGKPGDIIRSEALTPDPGLTNARSYRVLYRTEMPDGSPRVSGAMLFLPTGPTPAGGRKVIAWAHPTVGMGDSCAPSRSTQPTQNMDWLQGMLDRGWIVTASDYAGLGTEGIEYYLIGQNEAIDTINSVRMARQFPEPTPPTPTASSGTPRAGTPRCGQAPSPRHTHPSWTSWEWSGPHLRLSSRRW